MGTTFAVPAAILPLPYAFSQLSWGPAIIALLLGTCTTFYSSWLLAGLFNWNGQTYYRYRDLVKSIFGERLKTDHAVSCGSVCDCCMGLVIADALIPSSVHTQHT